MKNAFYVMSKAFFILKISTILSWLFGYEGKRIAQKAKVNFIIYDVTDWATSNYNTHIAQYLKKWRQSDNEIWSVNRVWLKKYFPEKPCKTVFLKSFI